MTNNPNEKNHKITINSLIKLVYFTLFFSLLNKGLLIYKEPALSHNLYLILHGFIADLTIPISIVALAIYFNRQTLTKFSAIFISFYNIVILADGLHFFKYDFRVNIELLYLKTWLKFVHLSRLEFASILILNLAIFYLLKTYSNKGNFISAKKKTFWLAFATTLIITQNFPLRANFKNYTNWDSFFTAKKAIARTDPGVSSFKNLFSKTIIDFFPDEIKLFLKSPFFLKFQEEFLRKTENQAFGKTPIGSAKIWTHRGFHENASQNSPEAVKLALKNGIKSFEIDIRYVYGINKIVISHDPYPPAILSARQDLFSFFGEIESELHLVDYIWLDFKNLYFTNIEDSIKILQEVSKKYDLNKKLLIESINPILLRKFSNAGFMTILARAYGNKNFKFNETRMYIMRAYAILSKCKFVSLPWQTSSDENTWKALNGYPVGFYTINDRNQLKRLSKEKSVFALLTDLELNPENL